MFLFEPLHLSERHAFEMPSIVSLCLPPSVRESNQILALRTFTWLYLSAAAVSGGVNDVALIGYFYLNI